MNDTELVRLVLSDPEAGFSLLTDRYLGLVASVVRGALGSSASNEDVEECIADVFAEFFRGAESFDPSRGTVKALLCTIAKRRAINAYGRKLRGAAVPLDELGEMPSEPPSPETLAVSAELRRTLLSEIDALGEPDREIIIRKYYLRESSAAIAKRLSMSVPAVNTRAHRAIRKLRKALEGQNDEK